MGNGCCSDDRYSQKSLPENAKLQGIVSVIKDVEIILPKLEKETNRTRQTLYYLCSESSTVSSNLPPIPTSTKRLREEIQGYQIDIQHLLFKGSSQNQPSSRGPMKRTIIRSKSSVLDRQDSGGKDAPEGQMDIELIVKALEIAFNEVKQIRDQLASMKIRLSKAKNQLEINVFDSVQTLSAEVQNLIGSKEEVLKDGIDHDEAIALVSQLSKPSSIWQRMQNLQKEMEDMRETTKTTCNQAELDLKDIELLFKEVIDLESVAFELIEEVKDALGSSPPSVPKVDQAKIEISPEKSKNEPSKEDYYKSKLEKLTSILTSEEGKLMKATSNLSKMREKLESTQGEVKNVKAKVLLYVGKLRETRILLRSMRVWRVGVEVEKLEEVETRHSTDEIYYKKKEDIRKFTRLMKILNKHHAFLAERYFQRFKETNIRLSCGLLGRPSAINVDKLVEIRGKSLVLAIKRCNFQVYRYALSRIRSASKAKQAIFRLKSALLRLIRFRLLSGIEKLRFWRGAQAIDDGNSEEGVGLDLGRIKAKVGEAPEVDLKVLKQSFEGGREQYQFEPASEDDIEVAAQSPSRSISEAELRSSIHSENIASEDSGPEENLEEGQTRVKLRSQLTRLGSLPFSRESIHF